MRTLDNLKFEKNGEEWMLPMWYLEPIFSDAEVEEAKKAVIECEPDYNYQPLKPKPTDDEWLRINTMLEEEGFSESEILEINLMVVAGETMDGAMQNVIWERDGVTMTW